MFYDILSRTVQNLNKYTENISAFLEKIDERNKKRKIVVVTDTFSSSNEWKDEWNGPIESELFFVNLKGERSSEYKKDTVLIVINGICDMIGTLLNYVQEEHDRLHKEKMDAIFLFHCEAHENYYREIWQRITPGEWLSLVEPHIYYRYDVTRRRIFYPYDVDRLAKDVNTGGGIKSSIKYILNSCAFS